MQGHAVSSAPVHCPRAPAACMHPAPGAGTVRQQRLQTRVGPLHPTPPPLLAHARTHRRLFIFYGDWHGLKELLGRAESLCEEGGDWERKNRLKVRRSAAHLTCSHASLYTCMGPPGPRVNAQRPPLCGVGPAPIFSHSVATGVTHARAWWCGAVRWPQRHSDLCARTRTRTCTALLACLHVPPKARAPPRLRRWPSSGTHVLFLYVRAGVPGHLRHVRARLQEGRRPVPGLDRHLHHVGTYLPAHMHACMHVAAFGASRQQQ